MILMKASFGQTAEIEYLAVILAKRKTVNPDVNSGCRSLYRSSVGNDRCPAYHCRHVALPVGTNTFGRGTFHNITILRLVRKIVHFLATSSSFPY